MTNRKKDPLAAAVDLLLLLLGTALFAVVFGGQEFLSGLLHGAPLSGTSQSQPAAVSSSDGGAPAADTLELRVLDVGQGLCLLLRCGDETMLLDAGEYTMASRVVHVLSENGVAALDYALNTHPHYDHYGALRMALRRVPVGEFLFGPVPEALIPTEAEYGRLLDYLAESKTPARQLAAGDTLALGGATLTVLGPLREYDSLNNESLVLRVTFGDTAFLLTGDMEAAAEADLIASGQPLSADVLVVGHHGSATSTTQELLRAVSPQYAAISVGLENDYGFPHDAVLSRLTSAGVSVWRTDLDGGIVFCSDGSAVTVAAASR